MGKVRLGHRIAGMEHGGVCWPETAVQPADTGQEEGREQTHHRQEVLTELGGYLAVDGHVHPQLFAECKEVKQLSLYFRLVAAGDVFLQ